MSSIIPKFKFDFSNNIAMLGYTWVYHISGKIQMIKFTSFSYMHHGYPMISLHLPKDLPEKFNPYYPPKSRSAQYEPSLETLSIESILRVHS